MNLQSITRQQISTARIPGMGDYDPPEPTRKDYAHERIMEDTSEAARFICEESPDAVEQLVGHMLVHGLPSNRESNTEWQDQCWCQCDELLTSLRESMSDWAWEQVND